MSRSSVNTEGECKHGRVSATGNQLLRSAKYMYPYKSNRETKFVVYSFFLYQDTLIKKFESKFMHLLIKLYKRKKVQQEDRSNYSRISMEKHSPNCIN